MNIKDYIHLYLGCEVMRPDGRTILTLYGIQRTLAVHVENGELTYSSLNACKPILRPLDSITEEEAKEAWTKTIGVEYTRGNKDRILHNMATMSQFSPLIVHLLAKHFDLFNLIEAGLAIDKTTLTPTP